MSRWTVDNAGPAHIRRLGPRMSRSSETAPATPASTATLGPRTRDTLGRPRSRTAPVWLFLALACAPEPAKKPADSAAPERAPLELPPPTFVDSVPGRLVALGDVHGDYKAAKRALRLAGAIDTDEQWIGGDLTVVQTGDQLDRGDQEEKILELFERLAVDAHAAGGAFYSLLGNHEVMNVELDFRYVTEGGFADFADTPHDPDDPALAGFEPEERGRAAAFQPGGEWATALAGHNVLMVVGDSAFVHGGILPDHIDHGLPKINRHTQEWMRGEREVPDVLSGDDAPIWTRAYSDDEAEPDCEALAAAVEALGVSRIVVGHTVQDRANSACDGQVWRIDVGMAAYYDGVPMAIAIEDGEVTVLE